MLEVQYMESCTPKLISIQRSGFGRKRLSGTMILITIQVKGYKFHFL